MTRRRRVRLSSTQRTDMWSRWKAGQSLHEIGRAFGKDHVSIQFMLSQHGGIAPATRRRSLLTLTLPEREDISRGNCFCLHHSYFRRLSYGLRCICLRCFVCVSSVAHAATRTFSRESSTTPLNY